MKFDRVLVIANETTAGRKLHRQITEMCSETAKVMVVAPALSSRLKYVFSDVDGPREQARARLDDSLEALAAAGIRAEGEVGDANPVTAFQDAVAVFEPDAVVVSTHPEGRSNWLENGVVERIREHTSLPVAHVVVDLAAQEAEQRAVAG